MLRKLIFGSGMICSVLAASTIVYADKPSVVEFSFEEVEVRVDGNYQYVNAKDIGTLPIAITNEDSKGWVEIETDYADDVWVSRTAVTLNGPQPEIECKKLAIGQPADKKQHGTRGAGGC